MSAAISRLHDFPDSETPQPAPSEHASVIRTRHYRDNRARVFRVELTGQTAYDLITYLESAAERAERYVEIAAAVKYAELLRDQLKTQGW